MKLLSRSCLHAYYSLIKKKNVKRPLVVALLSSVENANSLVTESTSLAHKVSAVLCDYFKIFELILLHWLKNMRL